MRRRRADKRDVIADPKYSSKLVTRFVNVIMTKGKKSIAEQILYNALDIVSKKINNDNTLEVLQKAIDNARPLLEIKPRRVGGATYQVPIEVKSDRGSSIAMRWIRDFARQKKGKPMRKIMMAGTSLAVIYNIIIFSPMGAIVEGLFLASNILGYYRHYIKKSGEGKVVGGL